jgi:Putative DNA-binding domain
MREAEFQEAIASVHARVPHQRFPIYRNNVVSGLVTALAVRFPVTQQLVGEEFFRAMAAYYVEDTKPASAVLIHYGESFSDFIAAFEPASAVPYLADVAQLENLWWKAYHVADTISVEVKVLGTFPPDALGDLRFSLHPSAGVMTSPFAVSKIWHAHHGGGALGTFAIAFPDHVVVSRPASDVEVRAVSQGFATLLRALLGKARLMDAVADAAAADPAFDLTSALQQVFELNLVSGVYND